MSVPPPPLSYIRNAAVEFSFDIMAYHIHASPSTVYEYVVTAHAVCVRASIAAAERAVRLTTAAQPTGMDHDLSLYPLWEGSSKGDTPRTVSPVEEVGDGACVCLCAAQPALQTIPHSPPPPPNPHTHLPQTLIR